MKAIIVSCVFCTLFLCFFVFLQSEDLGYNEIKAENFDLQGINIISLDGSLTSVEQDPAVSSPFPITNKQSMSLPNAPIIGGSQNVDQIPAIERHSGTADFISSPKSLMPVADKSLSNANLNQNLSIRNLSKDSQSEGLDMEISIPRGARLPAAIVDASKNLTPTQTEVMDAISEKFLDSAMPSSNVPQDVTPKNISEKKWSQSLNEANERYRSLFGVDAYNAWTSQAAKEALNDQH